jgi:hypothetical protein
VLLKISLMNSHTHETPPTLSTGYDLLPLPSLEQFESDRNLPVPTRRITVDELVKVIHGEGEDADVEAGVRKLGKVRVYGRIVQVNARLKDQLESRSSRRRD